MQVVLLRDVRGLGGAFEVKDVADGYARNYLFPHHFAEPATKEKLKQLEMRRQLKEAERAKEEEQLAHKIQSLHGKTVTVNARATEKGGLFKTVGVPDIAKAIRAEHSLEIPHGAIHCDPIKTLGEHKISLASHAHKAELMVAVKGL